MECRFDEQNQLRGGDGQILGSGRIPQAGHIVRPTWDFQLFVTAESDRFHRLTDPAAVDPGGPQQRLPGPHDLSAGEIQVVRQTLRLVAERRSGAVVNKRWGLDA